MNWQTAYTYALVEVAKQQAQLQQQQANRTNDMYKALSESNDLYEFKKRLYELQQERIRKEEQIKREKEKAKEKANQNAAIYILVVAAIVVLVCTVKAALGT